MYKVNTVVNYLKDFKNIYLFNDNKFGLYTDDPTIDIYNQLDEKMGDVNDSYYTLSRFDYV